MREPGSSHHPEDCQAYFSGLLPLAGMTLQNCVDAKQAKRYSRLAETRHGPCPVTILPYGNVPMSNHHQAASKDF